MKFNVEPPINNVKDFTSVAVRAHTWEMDLLARNHVRHSIPIQIRFQSVPKMGKRLELLKLRVTMKQGLLSTGFNPYLLFWLQS